MPALAAMAPAPSWAVMGLCNEVKTWGLDIGGPYLVICSILPSYCHVLTL